MGYPPPGGVVAVNIVVPVTDAVLLVEAGLVSADVGDTAAVLVAHVEDVAVVLHVSVETDRLVRAVKRERHVRELLPPLGL